MCSQKSPASAKTAKDRAYDMANRIMASAPFPGLETRALARAMRSVGLNLGIVLILKKSTITHDGRFEITLDTDGPLKGTGTEKQDFFRQVTRMMTQNTSPWTSRNPNNLQFFSPVYSSLKGKPTLTASLKETIGLKTTPTSPEARTLCAACAILIQEGAHQEHATTPKNKELNALILTLSAIDKNAKNTVEKAVKRPRGAISEGTPSGVYTVMFTKSTPFRDPVLNAQARLLHAALASVNPDSIKKDKEYYTVAVDRTSQNPNIANTITPEERAKNIDVLLVKLSDQNSVNAVDSALVEGLATSSGFTPLAFGHTHSAPSITGGSEFFSLNDIAYAKSKGWNAALATPRGKYLFYVYEEDKVYDATEAYGQVPIN